MSASLVGSEMCIRDRSGAAWFNVPHPTASATVELTRAQLPSRSPRREAECGKGPQWWGRRPWCCEAT
eukprot:6625552-Alexandrium_andersonii.AAC.1